MWELSDQKTSDIAEEYKPCLVLHPEHREDLLLRDGDFHPRGVHLFLSDVRLRRGLAGWIGVVGG